MKPEELAEAKRYGRADLVCTLLDRGLDLAYLAVMATLLARPIDDWLQRCPLLERWWSLRLVVFFVILFGVHVCVSFPLSFYSGHVLEHRFKLSKLTFLGWLWRYAKINGLALALGAAMWLGLFWIIWTTGPWWWLVAAGAFFLVSIVLGRLFPVLIQPLFYKIQPLDNPELAARIARLAEGTGLAIEGVYRMGLSEETVKGNAQLAGLGKTRRVLLGDTLLDHYSPDEIEVVFAHEIGHHVFHHIRNMIVVGVILSAAGFWIVDRLLLAWVGRNGAAGGYGELPVYALPMLELILAVFMTVLGPITNTLARRYERQCDRYALARTGLRHAYLSAFRKLARQNKDDPDPHPLEVWLFHSHPPIAERLAMAESQGADAQGTVPFVRPEESVRDLPER